MKVSFAIGDTVRHVESGTIGMITHVMFDPWNYGLEYGIDGSAWYSPPLELIREADEESVSKCASMLREDEEYEEF